MLCTLIYTLIHTYSDTHTFMQLLLSAGKLVVFPGQSEVL